MLGLKKIANLGVLCSITIYPLTKVTIRVSKIEDAREVESDIKKKVKRNKRTNKHHKIQVCIIIPEGTEIIEREAFNGCNFITSIEIPDSVTSIGELAFSGCTNISRIDIPDSVKKIGDFAFNNCKSLRTVKISKNVEKIGKQIFHNCTNLQTVRTPETVDTKTLFSNEDAWGKVSIEFI